MSNDAPHVPAPKAVSMGYAPQLADCRIGDPSPHELDGEHRGVYRVLRVVWSKPAMTYDGAE